MRKRGEKMRHPIIFCASLALVVVCLALAWKMDMFGTVGWMLYACWCGLCLAAFAYGFLL